MSDDRYEEREKYRNQIADLQTQLLEAQRQVDAVNAMGTVLQDKRGFTQIGAGINRYGEARPGYTSIIDAQGNLDPRYTQTLGESFTTLKDKALAEGDMESTKLMRQQLGQMDAASRDRLALETQGALAGAQANLAMRGGLGGGAAERLAARGQLGLMSGQQQLGRQYNQQNLGLSLADESMRNQLLGQIGAEEQNIQRQNIQRQTDDIGNQNLYIGSIYAEDMKAYAAEKSAQAQAAASCFMAGTEVEMEGGKKRIEDIRLGDICSEGGKVYFLSQSLAPYYYRWRGVSVTGTHAVKLDGRWVRIEDLPDAERIDREIVTYCLSNVNHIMLVKENIFSDFHENERFEELDLDESIKYMNGEL